MKYQLGWIVLPLLLLSSGCSEVQQSAGQVLDNAGSVIRSGDEKLWIPPSDSRGRPAEASAGKVLDNAGSTIRTGRQKVWQEGTDPYREEDSDTY